VGASWYKILEGLMIIRRTDEILKGLTILEGLTKILEGLTKRKAGSRRGARTAGHALLPSLLRCTPCFRG